MTDVRIRLRDIIHERGFTQAVIARKACMTPQQLTDVLRLRRKLEANEMIALCDVMGINMNDLVSDDTDQPA